MDLARQVRMPDPQIYTAMGADRITRMIEAVYEKLYVSPIAAMFPSDHNQLLAAARNSALFWITACGGPPLYEEKHGPPRMRMRHARFIITREARDHWLAAWRPVLARACEDFGFPQEHLQGFADYLEDFSLWMVNAGSAQGIKISDS